MNPRDMRIAIAEANGYEWTMEAHLESGYHSWQNFADQCGNEVLDDELPDYCNDLNAMHEVWCSLTEKQHQYFRRELQFVIAEAGDNNIPHKGPCHSVCNATALQRAEAYLRTIGKWNEHPSK